MARTSADSGHVPPVLIARLAREGQAPDPNHSFNRFRLDPPTPAPVPVPIPAPALTPAHPSPTGQSRSRSTSSPEPKRKRNLHVRQKGEPAACRRCRKLKKKCSRTGPECAQCISVDLPCSFSTPPDALGTAPDSYNGSKDLQAHEPWLTRYGYNDAQPALGTPDVLRNGVVAGMNMGTDQSDGMDTSGQGDSGEIQDANRQLLAEQLRSPRIDRSSSVGNIARRMPEDTAGRAFVIAYFKHIHRAYPFMDKAKVLGDVDTMGDIITLGIENISTNLYMVMALGCYALRRAGQVSDAISAKFQISEQAMLQIMQKGLAKPKDVESVQTLLLLGLYCLFDPTGLSPYMISSLLASQVLSLGLSRKALPEQGLTLVEIEMRHRLFWSIYTLDRMVAVSCGLPFNLHDENVNVPLPGLTMEEYNSPEKGQYALVLQVHRQVVSLRQLEEKIMQKVHLSNTTSISLMSHAERHATIQELRSQVDDWYRTGCLLTPMEESDQIPFHNTIPWLNHRYQNLMLLLYSPSNLNNLITAGHFGELERSLQKYIQLSAVLIQKRHLPLNWVTLCRFVAICPLLLYCLMRRQAEHTISPLKEENSTCASVLDAFPDRWFIAKRAAHVYRNMTLLSLMDINKEIALLVKDMLGDCSLWKKAVEASTQLLQQRTEAPGSGAGLMMSPVMFREEELWEGIGDFGMEFM